MVCAPVKAPRSWPNSSHSSRSFGIAAGVDRHERAAGARRMLVQRARHQFLAGAGLAGDHHRHVALREPADGAEHVLHRRRLAQHFGAAAIRSSATSSRWLSSTARRISSIALGRSNGFGQVFESAALEGRDGAVQVGEGRHDDDRQAGMLFLDLVSRSRPEPPGMRMSLTRICGPSSSCRVQRLQHLARVGEAARRQVLAHQRFFEHEADGLVIVNDPDRLHVFPSPQVNCLVLRARGSGS
jgi:hypothetical protein